MKNIFKHLSLYQRLMKEVHCLIKMVPLLELILLTLCDPVDCSPPGSSIHGILQARILEWVAISFSRGSSRFFATPWTVAHQAPLSVESSRQEYWSGLPCPSPRDVPNPGIKPGSPTLQADSLPPSEPPGKPKPTGHEQD